MADNHPTNPKAPEGASTPIPHDNQIAYTVNAMGKPTFPGPEKPLPGHTNQASGVVRAEASARYEASQADAQSKHDAQFKRDTSTARPQHSKSSATFTSRKRGR